MIEYREEGTVFRSKGNRLVGIATIPASVASTGVLILVGGPQYRVGSHRQFTLLARSMAASGIPSFRFDFGGMGDSEGERQEFHEVQDDYSAALDRFQELVPGLERVVLWGLCDAASAAMMFAHREPRVQSMVLLNPWVHSGDYSPEVKLSHYYGPLLKGKDAWRRLFSGKIDIIPTVKEFSVDSVILVKKIASLSLGVPLRHLFVDLMLEGLERFRGRNLFILSSNDLTAQEFLGLVNNDRRWQKIMSEHQQQEVAGADHTFSRKPWQDDVTRLTIDWVQQQQ